MDGFKERLNASVRFKLSFALLVAIAAVALTAGALSFAAAYDEAQELQDDVLRQVARLIEVQGLAPVIVAPGAYFRKRDDATRLIVQRLGQPNPLRLHVDAGGPLPVPDTLSDGLRTLALDGEAFRVLIETTAAGERFVVAQEVDFRDQMARASALRTALPFLVLIPVLLLIVGTLVRQMFRPIVALADGIDRRGEQELQPIGLDRVPGEVRPFVAAINRMLARVQQAMDAQRRFVADAAHELRSPLTALSLQAERLAQAPMSDSARQRLVVLRQGIERGRKLLDQLLALAKVQSASTPPAAATSIQAVCRRVLEDLMPLADARHIDLGMSEAQEARVTVSELELGALVENLVGNAIRYSPEGGRVDLGTRVEAGRVAIEVSDTGPGIAVRERERVFDPFYRVLGTEPAGSGLGLAIVKTIADRLGARITLDWADAVAQTGLRVVVSIPLRGAGAA